MRLRIIFKIVFVTAGVALALYCLSFIYFYYQEKPEAGIQLPALPIVQKETRLLVIAPHCDDEALGCGGMIHDVIIKIPLTQIKVPHFFFIQAVTKDKHKVVIDQTVWQPVFFSKF